MKKFHIKCQVGDHRFEYLFEDDDNHVDIILSGMTKQIFEYKILSEDAADGIAFMIGQQVEKHRIWKEKMQKGDWFE